jgi:cytidylate kinase
MPLKKRARKAGRRDSFDIFGGSVYGYREVFMAIITISRELAALGDETAAEVSKMLGYRLVDKTALEERIKTYGVEGRKLERYDERKLSFWASLSQDRDDYLHYLKSAILAEAAAGNCVIIGRGSSLILRGVPGLLSVFLGAPLEIRVERVKSYFHCDDRRARQIIDQSDRDREGFHRYSFDTRWQDPAIYHITLNAGRQHPAAMAKTIRCLKEQTVTEETDARGLLCLQELILGQGIKHHILYDKEISIHFLEASVSGGKAVLYGVANSAALVEAALGAARETAGELPVESEIQVVREYSVMP